MRKLAVALVLAAGCGGGATNVRPQGAEGEAPAWISEGTGAITDESGRKLQGTGSARNSDPRLRRQAADNAATLQLDKNIGALADQLARLSEGKKPNAAEEITAIARRAELIVPHVRDHWVLADGSENALDQVDLAAFKQALQAVEGDESLKREMADNAERAFDSLRKP